MRKEEDDGVVSNKGPELDAARYRSLMLLRHWPCGEESQRWRLCSGERKCECSEGCWQERRWKWFVRRVMVIVEEKRGSNGDLIKVEVEKMGNWKGEIVERLAMGEDKRV
ncbi:hypothetical protein HAX54_023206 [Datura stramonium]|uniref:Uncharacterized protein n=1 Tax=Datura stramonium TaxID=4076 RepID=A0ABS8S716_DATST|nr:hypothetical protein [Datura stramonium]